jgi:tetratricopeptide (TPR) repeat protein
MKAAISYDEKFSDFAKRPSSCSPDYFRLHYHLGLIYEYQNEIIKATNTYKVAALFMNKEDSLEVKESQALIFEHLGNILYKEKSYIEARSHYLRLLEIWSEFKRLVPSESLISINWRITNIFYYEKDFINTEIWIKNTLKFVNEVMKPNDVLMNETYFGTNQLLGLIYEAKMEYKKAFYTYNNLLKYLKKLQKKEDNKILEIKTSLNRVKNELPLFFNILN